MSRSIEAAIGEPTAVSMPLLRLTAVSPGLNPFFAAIAQHSSNMALANWLAPPAAMSPKAPRLPPPMPAPPAIETPFPPLPSAIPPQLLEDRGRELGVELGAGKSRSDRRHALRFRAVLFAERDKMQIIQMKDAAFAIERCRDDALAAEHRAGAEPRGEQIYMLHAVEQRQDRRVGAHCRRKGIHRALQIIGLAAQQDQIERRAQIF